MHVARTLFAKKIFQPIKLRGWLLSANLLVLTKAIIEIGNVMNAKNTIKILKSIPTSESVLLAAKHGVGKSSVVRQVADELGGQFHDVRLSQCEVGDIKGLPLLNDVEGRTEFLKPYWWPRDQDSTGILFFDELNRATKDVLQAVFEICLDRRLDGEKLPDGWRVVAAINADDDYDVVELDPALLDRWFYIDFDPDVNEWVSWAVKNEVHPSIIEFIQQNPELLDPPVGNLEAGKVYPSRRSWAKFDLTLKSLNLYESVDEGLITQIAKGWVGTTASIAYPKFLANEFARLRPEEIIDNLEEVRGKVESAASDIESVAALSQSVLRAVSKRTAASMKTEQCENLKEFMQLLPKDVASQFWLGLMDIKHMRKTLISWQTDAKFSSFMKEIYCK